MRHDHPVPRQASRETELVPSSCQPTKAEQEESIGFPESTTSDDLARAAMQPVGRGVLCTRQRQTRACAFEDDPLSRSGSRKVSRDMDRPETMPAGSGIVCATAADLPGPVEQRRGADDGSAHRREEHFRFQALKAAVQEGLDSGESNRTIPVIMEEVEARLRGEDRL